MEHRRINCRMNPHHRYTTINDSDSVLSWSVTSDDDVFDDDIDHCHDEYIRRRRSNLSSISDWILLGKYNQASRSHYATNRVSPYKKPRSLDGCYSLLPPSGQVSNDGSPYRSPCPCLPILQEEYDQCPDRVRRKLYFDSRSSSRDFRCRSRSESDYNVSRKDNQDEKEMLCRELIQKLNEHRERLSDSEESAESETMLRKDPILSAYNERCPPTETADTCCDGPREKSKSNCSCSAFEKNVMLLAESAYKNIRRPDRSPQAFRRFRSELLQTNHALKESLELLQSIRLFCGHHSDRAR